MVRYGTEVKIIGVDDPGEPQAVRIRQLDGDEMTVSIVDLRADGGFDEITAAIEAMTGRRIGAE